MKPGNLMSGEAWHKGITSGEMGTQSVLQADMKKPGFLRVGLSVWILLT
jgi:hypothetical protein